MSIVSSPPGSSKNGSYDAPSEVNEKSEIITFFKHFLQDYFRGESGLDNGTSSLVPLCQQAFKQLFPQTPFNAELLKDTYLVLCIEQLVYKILFETCTALEMAVPPKEVPAIIFSKLERRFGSQAVSTINKVWINEYFQKRFHEANINFHVQQQQLVEFGQLVIDTKFYIMRQPEANFNMNSVLNILANRDIPLVPHTVQTLKAYYSSKVEAVHG